MYKTTPAAVLRCCVSARMHARELSIKGNTQFRFYQMVQCSSDVQTKERAAGHFPRFLWSAEDSSDVWHAAAACHLWLISFAPNRSDNPFRVFLLVMRTKR